MFGSFVRAFVATAFLCAALALPAAAQVVDRIEVNGNQRVEDGTVTSYIPIAPGTFVTDADVDRALKALFATGLFSDVTLRRQGTTLVVSVVESPVINRLAFEGNRKIRTELLEAEVQIRPRVVFTRARIQADVQRLLQVYRRSGRFAATVEPKVIQLEQNRVDFVFEINEGPVTGIAASISSATRPSPIASFAAKSPPRNHASMGFSAPAIRTIRTASHSIVSCCVGSI